MCVLTICVKFLISLLDKYHLLEHTLFIWLMLEWNLTQYIKHYSFEYTLNLICVCHYYYFFLNIYNFFHWNMLSLTFNVCKKSKTENLQFWTRVCYPVLTWYPINTKFPLDSNFLASLRPDMVRLLPVDGSQTALLHFYACPITFTGTITWIIITGSLLSCCLKFIFKNNFLKTTFLGLNI